jgi:bifunctional DNA-binding transcriptional regulator/antitoxin component of YhaV-PrlF toxin-antitoxin module/ribosomal protein L40E
MTTKKRGFPQKPCPECNTDNHARSSNCKSCDYTFYVRKKDKEVELARNWRDLKAGDVIKVITGSGSYFLSKYNKNEDGSPLKISLGHKGKFEVVEIVDQGSKSCGIIGRQLYVRGRRANVTEFIYMGETYYNEDMLSHNESHRIKVLKKNE